MVKITSQPTATLSNGEVLHGSYANVKQADPADVQHMLNAIAYPLPDFDIVLLPFIIQGAAYEEYWAITDNNGKTIYLSAIDQGPPPENMNGYYSMWAHEIGHIVHSQHMPTCPRKTPLQSEWQTFQQVHGISLDNLTTKTSVEEAFAEAWRYLFTPFHSDHTFIPKREIPEGVREWILSLDGSLTLRPDHPTAYKGGEVYPLDVAPRIENGRAMVPLRFVSERLGKQVHWDGQSIIING